MIWLEVEEAASTIGLKYEGKKNLVVRRGKMPECDVDSPKYRVYGKFKSSISSKLFILFVSQANNNLETCIQHALSICLYTRCFGHFFSYATIDALDAQYIL